MLSISDDDHTRLLNLREWRSKDYWSPLPPTSCHFVSSLLSVLPNTQNKLIKSSVRHGNFSAFILPPFTSVTWDAGNNTCFRAVIPPRRVDISLWSPPPAPLITNVFRLCQHAALIANRFIFKCVEGDLWQRSWKQGVGLRGGEDQMVLQRHAACCVALNLAAIHLKRNIFPQDSGWKQSQSNPWTSAYQESNCVTAVKRN